jgi:hypothetical protein
MRPFRPSDLLSEDQRVFARAVGEFWEVRRKQGAKGSASDRGTRSAVTGGKQMDGFVRTIQELMIRVGVQEKDIHFGMGDTPLPGYFRPTKRWDLVVVSDEHLLAAIELKSQVGSLGNNFNNRTEEAMGSALDIWTAYREGAFKNSPQPWLGYLLLLEDSSRSRSSVAVQEPHFPVFPEFQGASYQQRYELFCRRLVLERHYSAACFLVSDPETADLRDNYLEPAEDLSAVSFLSQLLRHIQR